MDRAALQKQGEKAFLEKFRSLYPRFPSGEIVSSEAPDFVIENNDMCLGIEVTEFPSQPPSGEAPRAQESRGARALRRAEEACRANGLLHFQVNVNFHPGRRLEPSRESDFVSELAQLIQRNLPNVGEKIHLSSTPRSVDLPPEEVISVSIHHPSNLDEQSYVLPSYGGVSKKYTLRELQEEINRKERKVLTYRQLCPQVWLLVAGGQILPSTWIDLPDGINEHKFQSSFDKVFFLHDYRSEIIELLLDRK